MSNAAIHLLGLDSDDMGLVSILTSRLWVIAVREVGEGGGALCRSGMDRGSQVVPTAVVNDLYAQ